MIAQFPAIPNSLRSEKVLAMKSSATIENGISSEKLASPKTRDDAHPDVKAIMLDGTKVDDAMTQAARIALRTHAQAGDSIPLWIDGKVVWKPAAEVLANLES